MAKEIIAVTDGTLPFGDSSLETKTKQDGFEDKGDIYKVKTHLVNITNSSSKC